MSKLLMGISQNNLSIGHIVLEGELTVAERVGSLILFEGYLATMRGSSFHQIEL